MENFPAQADRADVVCRHELQKADFFVGVLGNGYGSIVQQLGISYSELEYDTACMMGLRPLMLLPSGKCRLRRVQVKHHGVSKQRAFKARVRQENYAPFYNNPADLAGKIKDALHKARIESLTLKGDGGGAPAPQTTTSAHQDAGADPAMVRRIRSALLALDYDPVEAQFDPSVKLDYERAVVHSNQGGPYPDPDPDGHRGIGTWFKVDLFDTYESGLKVLLGGRTGLVSRHGFWDVVDDIGATHREAYHGHDIWTVGCIPYAVITEFRPDGDDWYGDPHIYCDFRFNGEPYETLEHYASVRDRESGTLKGFVKLDPAKRRHLE
jgi:hypothetical protein